MLCRLPLPLGFFRFSCCAMKAGLTRFTTAALFVAFVISQTNFTPRAFGGLVIQPTAVSTNSQVIVGALDHIRNQSGLSAGYTSLVTNFDTYVGSGPTTQSLSPVDNFMSFLTSSGNVDFNLGGTFTIESFALWNGGQSGVNGTSSGIRDFQLLVSADSSFSNSISLGNFVANQAPSIGPIGAQIFTFAPTSAAFVRLASTSTHGAPFTTINEVAFEGTAITAVPEPSSLALLFAASTFGLIRLRRTGSALRLGCDRKAQS